MTAIFSTRESNLGYGNPNLDTGQKLKDPQRKQNNKGKGKDKGKKGDSYNPIFGRPGIRKLEDTISSNAQNINFNDFADLPTDQEAFEKQRQISEERRYGAYKAKLDDQYKVRDDEYGQEMANRGLVPGTAAYDRAYKNFASEKGQAYSDARENAFNAAVGDQSQSISNLLGQRKQVMDERTLPLNLKNQIYQSLVGGRGTAADLALKNKQVNQAGRRGGGGQNPYQQAAAAAEYEAIQARLRRDSENNPY